ncbi:MAG: 30S ribosomal protein S6 [Ignavibacteriota bacterium]|jgi:small subunit ribosomal protein S6|nr:MAG: 30S ribosomal protein S6 [Chlorobiota bacterium]MBE7476391.1 30S ribosomal protein S6 [Ignavibacteriales bacterium]MBL1124374.1 30S ribosomal protein S6 [Ignavibacteriota bacterium]MBV6420699.1 30S ribosomal protein S6 [Ignavibacteriaceae bacterium]MCE7855459.1 30S ribosomal protein S6 [Ignavibacteria bacterium CHB3]MEB2295500.1 30S ribosomal protein S6 [Ignavibacteria bacterium]
MNKRVYESAVLINAALDDEAIKILISKIKETISGNGGEIREIEDWGRKRLAYQIKKSKIGYYVIFRFDSQPDLITKLERYYQLDETILRYLTITLSNDALEQIDIDKAQQTQLVEEVEEIPIVISEAEEDDEETTEKDA